MEPTFPQHDETIVPVRPGLRPGAGGQHPEAAAPSKPVRPRPRPIAALAVAGALAAAAAVFFWLPAQVSGDRPASAPPEAGVELSAEPAGPVLSPAEQQALKVRAEDLLAGLLTLQSRLTSLSPRDWAGEDWQRYEELSETGDNAFLADDFPAAIASYAEARTLGNALIERASTSVDTSLVAAEAAVAAGNAGLALEHYALVLTIEPSNAAALAGRARAERLPEVLALMQRASVERARGELQTALATYREALALDPHWPAASAGVAEVNGALHNAEFERVLSAGFGLLAAQDYLAAQRELEAALALRPSSREAAEGLAQAEQGVKLDQIALTEARALAFERRELWNQAIALYRAVLETDDTLVFAQTGLERAEARAALDTKLTHLIDNPTLLFGDAVLADARKLLEAAAEQEQGQRLDGQIAALGRLVEAASRPISVRIESDRLTTVTLYRVGALGAFAAKEVELRPGTYTVIGSRDGYRDVRRTFTVRPGRDLPAISVVCVEPI